MSASTRAHNHRLLRLVLFAAVIALVATACDYDPSQMTKPAFSECFGQQATIGIGWYGPEDGPSGSSYVGTEGDDVVVITNGPVRFDGLGGNDLICVNDTGLASSTPPIKIDAGDGDDRVWDRRYRRDDPPSHVALEVDLGDGDDAFYGSAAKDVVDAGDGADRVNGGGGVDVIDCGPGTDLQWTGDFTHPATTTDCEATAAGYGPVDEHAVQTLLDEFRANTYAFGTQLGLRVPGQPDTLVASGVDDRFPDTPMPIDGTFRVASITKTFTSALILQLVEQGHFDLDDTLDQWLPDYPHADAITVRQLLQHTSGVADYMNDAATNPTWIGMIFGDLARVWTLEEVIDLNATATPYAAPPHEFHYSNGNYWALGHIIEQVTGQPYAQVLQERILDPHGLDDTVVDDGTATLTQHGWWGIGTGSVEDGTFDPLVPRTFDALDWNGTAWQTFVGPAGAIVSTTADLLDWAEILYGGEFLGEAMTAELRTLRAWDADRPGHRYGLGVEGTCPCDPSTDPPGVTILGHKGNGTAIATTATAFAHDTATGISIANRSNVREISLLDRDDLLNDAIALITGG